MSTASNISAMFHSLNWSSTFMGIAIHNLSASSGPAVSIDLAAGVRQDAAGIFGTTAQLSDLVRD